MAKSLLSEELQSALDAINDDKNSLNALTTQDLQDALNAIQAEKQANNDNNSNVTTAEFKLDNTVKPLKVSNHINYYLPFEENAKALRFDFLRGELKARASRFDMDLWYSLERRIYLTNEKTILPSYGTLNSFDSLSSALNSNPSNVYLITWFEECQPLDVEDESIKQYRKQEMVNLAELEKFVHPSEEKVFKSFKKPSMPFYQLVKSLPKTMEATPPPFANVYLKNNCEYLSFIVDFDTLLQSGSVVDKKSLRMEPFLPSGYYEFLTPQLLKHFKSHLDLSNPQTRTQITQFLSGKNKSGKILKALLPLQN
jgi:hypothetical protein